MSDADGKVIVKVGLDKKEFESGLISLSQFVEKIEQDMGRKLTAEEKQIAEQVYTDIRDKIFAIEGTLERMTKDASKGIKNVVKNVARWGLALFSIRGAYSMLRNSMSTITSQDEQLKADLDYMKNAIAYILEPAVRRIIDWAKQLLFYIGYIIKIWTGKNIFENANKSLKNADKSAKALQKTLAGFDEMNILNSNGSVGVAGATPSFDLTGLNGVSMPDWIYWIAQNKEIVLGFVQALIVGLTALKYGVEGIMFLGIGVAIISLISFVKDLITLINDPSWQNFYKVLQDLANVIVGVGLAMVGLNATNPAGWIVLAVGVIGNFIAKLFEEEDATKKLTVAKDRLNQAEREFVNAQTTYVSAIENRNNALKELKAIEERTKESGEQLYNSVIFGKQTYEQMTEEQKETYLAYVKFKGALSDVETATKNLQDKEHKQILEMVNVQSETAKSTGKFEELGKTVNELVKNGKLSTNEARDLLKNTYKDLDKDGKKLFKEQMPKYIDASTEATKDLLRELSKVYNQYDAIYRAGSRAHSVGSTYKAKGGIAYAKGGIIPTIKLASGAIINKPSSGIPIGGERGAEGVVPLTDSQQMDLLGEAIGRHVTINATIPVYAYNREVDRKIKRIKAEDDFAYNR